MKQNHFRKIKIENDYIVKSGTINKNKKANNQLTLY